MALENWKVYYKEANKIKSRGFCRGSSLHAYVENYLKNRINERSFESNELYKNMANEIINKGITGRLDEIYGTEVTLFYPKKYAKNS